MSTEDQQSALNSDNSPTATLIARASAVAKKGPPPVHLWNPPFTGDIDIRIARDGTWYHEGGPIKRPALVRLFASILRREGDDYFLVTPVEKNRITVEDAPFIAIDFETAEENGEPVLIFETNVGDTVRASAENAISVTIDPDTGEPSPYIHVRRDLHALIDRKSFYRLADLAEPTQTATGEQMTIRSGGTAFTIGPAE